MRKVNVCSADGSRQRKSRLRLNIYREEVLSRNIIGIEQRLYVAVEPTRPTEYYLQLSSFICVTRGKA
jgi:hypothetical protein